jgi:S-formylglutathione hydrolase FrmB
MPAVHRSFYADEARGHPYWTFLTDELPHLVSSFFHVSTRPEDTFVAGLSMGGYGALKWALREPHRFAAAASLSGVLDLAALVDQRQELFARVFDGTPGEDDDLFALLAAADAPALPPLHISCGTEDPLVDGNRRFVRAAQAVGAELTVDFRPGEHEWDFWDDEIQQVLAWLPRAE